MKPTWLTLILLFTSLFYGPALMAGPDDPYHYLLQNEGKIPLMKEWVWPPGKEKPFYLNTFDPSVMFRSIFPEFENWQTLSARNNPTLQRWIDEAFFIYFQSAPIRKVLCYLYTNADSLSNFGGVSVARAKELMKACEGVTGAETPPPSHVQSFEKEFLFLFAKSNEDYPTTAPIRPSSWTDMANVTYLFVTPETRFSDLVLSILHEIAIQSDAKSKMGLVEYKLMTSIDLDQDEINLFKLASIDSIDLTFATMRAFEVEKHLLVGLGSLSNKPLSSENCAEAFNQTFAYVSKLAHRYSAKMQTQFLRSARNWNISSKMEAFAKSLNLRTEREIIDFLMKSKIRTTPGLFYDGKSSFCEFMTSPHLANKKYLTLSSHGPRPSVVGGAHSISTDAVLANIERVIRKRIRDTEQ